MLLAYLLVVAEPGAARAIAEALDHLPGIILVHEVSGPYHVVAKVRAPTERELGRIVTQRVRCLDGLRSVTTLVREPD